MKFFLRTLIFLGLLLIGYIILVFGQAGNPTQMSQWVYDVYQKKEKRAKAIKGKKIIITGGSDVLFGVDSKMISDAFGLPVVNYGVNAGIDLPLILHMTKKVIKPNDIVLFPLVYSMYSYRYDEIGQQMIDYLFAREADFFGKLTLAEQWYILWHITAKRIYNGYFYKGGTPIHYGLYGEHNVNANGDQIHTEKAYRTKQAWENINKQSQIPVSFGKKYNKNSLGWKYLREFVLWCQKKNVQVIFMPTTIMFSKFYHDDEKEKWLYTHIGEEVKKRGWLYVGEPYDYMYKKNAYFNTRYHLIDSARKIHTKKLIDILKKSRVIDAYK